MTTNPPQLAHYGDIRMTQLLAAKAATAALHRAHEQRQAQPPLPQQEVKK